MRYQGQIIEWNDARGFGFVRRHGDADGKVFVHIRAFSARGCRPQVGDVVSYAVGRDERGRPRAVDAEMVVVRGRGRRSRRPGPAPAIPLSRILWIAVACVIVVVLATADWRSLIGRFTTGPAATSPPTHSMPLAGSTTPTPAFRCSGKRYCSQMNSCAEAKFYLKNCPGTLSDGDHDGIPCEDQWCGH